MSQIESPIHDLLWSLHGLTELTVQREATGWRAMALFEHHVVWEPVDLTERLHESRDDALVALYAALTHR